MDYDEYGFVVQYNEEMMEGSDEKMIEFQWPEHERSILIDGKVERVHLRGYKPNKDFSDDEYTPDPNGHFVRIVPHRFEFADAKNE